MTGLRVQIPTELVKRMCDAQRIVVLTGAGISAESGVPTFREAQSGLWQQYNFEDLATAAAFERDPKLVWRWYDWRRQLLAKTEPNDGHRALVSMEDRCAGFTLITQNVDGLHAAPEVKTSSNYTEISIGLNVSKKTISCMIGRKLMKSHQNVATAELFCSPTWCGLGNLCRQRFFKQPSRQVAAVISSSVSAHLRLCGQRPPYLTKHCAVAARL